MGLQQALGYRYRPANAVQRGLQRLGMTKVGSWCFQRTLWRIDRPLHRWSKGRFSAAGVLAGLPVIMLTTTGAKSGQLRTMPLAGVPLGDHLAVLGTNYAQTHTPGWVFNLESHPRATVAWRNTSVPVTARLATANEIETVWATAATVYPGFRLYRERITERPVRIFVLEPAA